MRTALLVLGVSLISQAAVQPFDGAWTAAFNGRPLVRLELHAADGGLTGRIQLADIHVDQGGAVDRVDSDLPSPAALFDVVVRDRTITFTRHDGDDVDHFELTLTVQDSAQLRLILSDAEREELARDGIPAPKPFMLSRARP